MINFSAESDYAHSRHQESRDKWKGTCSLQSGDVIMETGYDYDTSFQAVEAVRTAFLTLFRNALRAQDDWTDMNIHVPGEAPKPSTQPRKAAGKGKTPPAPQETNSNPYDNAGEGNA